LYKRDIGMQKSLQYRITKMIKDLKHFSYDKQLRELGLFCLEKRRFGGDLINVYK